MVPVLVIALATIASGTLPYPVQSLPFAALSKRGRRLNSCGADHRPLVWRATRGSDTLFLAATIHLPLPVPAVLADVVRRADIAYFELPCAGDTYELEMAPCIVTDTTLAERIPASDLASWKAQMLRLLDSTDFLETNAACNTTRADVRSLVNNLEEMTLSVFAVESLVSSAATREGCSLSDATPLDLDDTLRKSFDDSGRPTFGTEDFSVHCALFQEWSLEEERRLVSYSSSRLANFLDNATALREVQEMDGMMDSWKCGDMDHFVSGVVDYPQFYQDRLLVERNLGMACTIDDAVKQNPGKVIFVGVGTLHYPDIGSTKGVLTLLQDYGFSITRLGADAELLNVSSNYTAHGAKMQESCMADVVCPHADESGSFAVSVATVISSSFLILLTSTWIL